MKKILGIASVEMQDFFPFGKQTYYFEDLVKNTSDTDIDAFFFSPLAWEKNKEKIQGYYFINGKWEKVVSSLPKIIYDRAFSKTEEDKIKINEFKKYLKVNKIPVLNPIDFADMLTHKIEFHNFLIDNKLPTLAALPVKYLTSNEFLKDIEKSKKYYLKPTFGSGGEGIYVIEKNNNTFLLNNFDNTNSKSFQSITDLFNFVKSAFDIKKYFIQPGADIIYFDERPFDIRVIVQNYGINDYRITGAGVRTGKQKSFVSNLNSGGSALPVEALTGYYQKHFQKNIFTELANISNMCLGCCKVLHKEFGNFLEIGFDILLTKDRGPIILEGNSKPSRWIFNVLADYYKDNSLQVKKYKKLRAETVRVPVLFAEKNFPSF